MHESIQPNEWVAVKFPSEQTRVLQIIPNTTIALGKYGAIPANLLIERPFHVTYEVQDRCDGEAFSRLRIVPAAELHADNIAETILSSTLPDADADADADPDADADVEAASPARGTVAETDLSALLRTADPSLVAASIAQSTAQVDSSVGISTLNMTANTTANGEGSTSGSTQTMTLDMIEALKRDGATDAGRHLVAKLLSSHTALARKTAYSLAKYRLLKVKKYLRRFTVLPLHPTTLANWFLDEREATRVLDMREEMMALVGCWANAHFSEMMPTEKTDTADVISDATTMTTATAEHHAEEEEEEEEVEEEEEEEEEMEFDPAVGGRWLVIDDTGGLLVAAVAERMGILYPEPVEHSGNAPREDDDATAMDVDEPNDHQQSQETPQPPPQQQQAGNGGGPARHAKPVSPNCARTNTITVIHTNSQPSMHALKYYGFDVASPPTRAPLHPLATNLLTLSWLQLLEPETDPIYSAKPDDAPAEDMASWKASRKSTYFRKLRRWKRVSHVIDSTRAGGFSGLAVASTMDPASILQHAMPLLAPGAPVAIYTQTIDPLARLADCFSTARRTEWTTNPPTAEDDDPQRWPGSEDFPVNPTLLLGVGVQSSRARRWQVLPGRTHPLMTGRGGSEGYVFTAWKAVPAVGKVQARGKYKRRKTDAGAGE